MRVTRKEFLAQSAMLPVSYFQALSRREIGAGLESPMGRFNVRDYAARGDGKTKDTEAIQAAINVAGEQGGIVHFPPGNYVSGTVRLKSHVAVELSPGATLLASPDEKDFDPYEKLDFESHSDRETTYFHYALLRGEEVHDVAIIGQGTIDGNRPRRGGPKPIAFKRCERIAIRDITMQNSPNYNISLLGCDYVDIYGVTIFNGFSDGIDPDCSRYVRIANCYIESWDDCICPKASFALGHRRSTENVTVTNCVLTTACNAFKLGTESSGDFKNITFNNCGIFGRPEKWNRAPISGVAIEMVDGASIDRISVSNVAMAGVRAPIFIRQGNRGRAQAVPTPETLQNVTISDITATNATTASSISGLAGHPAKRISLSNIHISAAGGGTVEQAHREIPEQASAYPEATMFGVLPAYALYCRHVDGLTLSNLHFHLESTDQRPALVVDDVRNLDLLSFRADPVSGDEPLLWLHNVGDSFVSAARAARGSKVFLRISGNQTEGVRALGNDLSEAALAFQLDTGVRAGAFVEKNNFLAPIK